MLDQAMVKFSKASTSIWQGGIHFWVATRVVNDQLLMVGLTFPELWREIFGNPRARPGRHRDDGRHRFAGPGLHAGLRAIAKADSAVVAASSQLFIGSGVDRCGNDWNRSNMYQLPRLAIQKCRIWTSIKHQQEEE